MTYKNYHFGLTTSRSIYSTAMYTADYWEMDQRGDQKKLHSQPSHV